MKATIVAAGLAIAGGLAAALVLSGVAHSQANPYAKFNLQPIGATEGSGGRSSAWLFDATNGKVIHCVAGATTAPPACTATSLP